MARRFKRENFLFPTDLDQPRVQVAASPVDAYERASEGTVEQAPQRPYEVARISQGNRLLDLGRSLGVASEVAQDIGESQYKGYVERAEATGVALATEDQARGNRQGFRQFVSSTRLSSGDGAAREVMGMSPHLKRSFDQTVARSAALGYNAALQAEFSTNPLVDEQNDVRLHDVEVSDPLYQRWVTGFTESFEETNGTLGLDPTARAVLIPALQDTQSRVTLAQDELRSERRLQAYEDQTNELINNTVFELTGNAEWVEGRDPNAQILAGNIISQQLDEAVSLGYGGQDLDAIYGGTVESIIALASQTNDPRVLDILESIEVGPPNDRTLLLDKANGGKYRMAAASASQQITDRQFQDGQRERQVRDQSREDSMNKTMEQLAVMAGAYEASGKSPEAYTALNNVIEAGRVKAAEFGYTVEFNSVIGRVLQEGVDNQGVPIVDYGAMASLENDIINERISGEPAQRRVRDMYLAGQLGNNQQAADNMLRLNSKIDQNTDAALAAFGSEVDEAANAFGQAVQGRYGYSEDEYGRVRSVRDSLVEAGFSEQHMVTLRSMSPQEAEDYIRNRTEQAAQGKDIPLTQEAISAINQVVNGGIDPLNLGAPPDPGDIERQKIEFKNQLYRGMNEFREREGRDMTPQERGQYIRDQSAASLIGQRATLPGSNPLSSARTDPEAFQDYQNTLFSETLGGVGSLGGDARTVRVLDQTQVIKGLEHYVLSEQWHPELVTLARNNGMTPMELIQTQSALNGATLDPDLAINIGMPTPAQASAEFTQLPGQRSVYSRQTDTSRSYSQGQYIVYRGDEPGPRGGRNHDGYDVTLEQNGSVAVNIPAPFDGVVVRVDEDAGGYGNFLIIKDRSTGQQMLLGHAAAIYLRPGDTFVRGQAIGKQGSTGRSSGEHIHIEILDRNGNLITNEDYMKPIIDDYMAYIESGSYMQPPAGGRAVPGGSGSVGLRPNSQPPQHGHLGYDEATDLVTIARDPGDGYEYKLQPVAAAAWRRMVNDARYEGIELVPVSAFRSVAEQQVLWDNQVARRGSPEAAARISAPPGHSEHHSGLTLDINSLSMDFKNSEAYAWLKNNGARYGFSQSFDGTGAVSEEPWHWSYTGTVGNGNGAGLPGRRGGSGGSAPASGGAPRNNGYQATKRINDWNSIKTAAQKLDVNPDELASLLMLESSLDPNARGGDDDLYIGLWQAGPDAQSRYGVYQGMPVGQQLAALVSYARDREYEPGMGIMALYSTVLAGNPWDLDNTDSNGTSAQGVVAQFKPGGRYHNEARVVFGM